MILPGCWGATARFSAGLPSFDCHIRDLKETSVSYFSQPRTNPKPANEAKSAPARAAAPVKNDVVSTFGHGMVITGNILCTGALQIYGEVSGEIHASQLTICEGAKVEGKVMAQDAVIHGHFKGTIHGNTVNLQSSAVVDGEIFNRSLTIEQNAQFEGVSRRLDQPVETPSLERHAEPPCSSYAPIEHALKEIVA
jgi:cytoskeletal protein CcmA (bactofilin family)